MRTCLHTCPRTLSLRSKLVARFLSLPVSLRAVLKSRRGNLITSSTLAHFCHSRWNEKLFFAKPKCEPATSHTCGVVEAICLLTDRHTAFAMTILNLPTNLVIAMERSDRSNPIASCLQSHRQQIATLRSR